jgi:predicted small secreted protein
MPLFPSTNNLFPDIGHGPLRTTDEASKEAEQAAEFAALRSDIHGTKQVLRAEDIVDGDTVKRGRITGFDTFESKLGDTNIKAKKLSDLGLTAPQQKQLGDVGTRELSSYLTTTPGQVAEITGHDVFGRALLNAPKVAEHMVGSGTAVPTDRYDEKLQTLYRNTRDKIGKMNPSLADAMDTQRDYNIDRQNPGLWGSIKQVPSALGSATQQLVAGIGDFALDVVTPGDNTLLNAAKSPEAADKQWGYDPRESTFRTKEAVAEFNRGNYGNALLQGGMVTPELLAESAPTIGSYFIPVVGEAKMAAWLGKTAQYLEKAKGSKDAADTMYKLANFARGNLGGFALNVGAQTNNDIEAFTQNNNGQAPDPSRIALMTANNVLQMGTDKFIDMSILKGKDLGKFVDTMKSATKAIPDNMLGAVAGKVAKTALALGEEGGQEYYQQWAQILNQKLGTTKYGSLENLMNNQEILDEALGAGLMGAAMGGGMSIAGTPVQMLDKANREQMINTIMSGRKPTETGVTSEPETPIPANIQTPQAKKTPDDMLKEFDAMEAHFQTTGEIGEHKEELDLQRAQWTDVKNAIDNKNVYDAMSIELASAEDPSRQAYLTDVLKKADSYTGKAKTVFDAVEGTPNEQVYVNADSVLRAMGSEWDTKNARALDIADAIQAVETIREIRNDNGITAKSTKIEDAIYNKAVDHVKNVIVSQLGKYQGFDKMSGEDKIGIIGDELYGWLKQSAPTEDINSYMSSMLYPVMDAILESKSFGSEPKTGMVYKGINLDDMQPEAPFKKDRVTQDAQKAGVKARVEKKLYADTSMQVDDTSTDAHTGISKGSINKLAETFKVPAGKVKAALDIAFQRMQIRKMADVSKESNAAQYEIYHGKDGILTNFVKYKTAAEKGNKEVATEVINNLVKRYVDQSYKYKIAMDSIRPTVDKIKALGKDATFEELKEAVGKVRVTIQGATGSDSEYTIDGMSIAKMMTSVPEKVREQIKMNAGGYVFAAVKESVDHLQDMFKREGLEDILPEVKYNKVLREDIYNSLVKTISKLVEERDRLMKEDLNPTIARTGEELDRMADTAKELVKLEATISKRIGEQQKVFQLRSGNLYQYNNTTFKDGKEEADVTSKMGQTVGTVTNEQAEKLGLNMEEGTIEDYVPMKSVDEYKQVLDKIEALKVEKATTEANINELESGITEQRKNKKTLLSKLKTLEKELTGESKQALVNAKKSADSADRMVTKLTVAAMKAKAKIAELRTAEAFLRKNEEVFKDAVLNADKIVVMQDEYGEWINSVITKTGKIPSAKDRNDKLREMVQSTTLLEEIVSNLNKVAKIGVILARKLMGVYTYDKTLADSVKEELAKTEARLTDVQEQLREVKAEQKEVVKDAQKEIVRAMREVGMTPNMSKDEMKNVLMYNSRMQGVRKKINKAKNMSVERVKELAKEIKELEGELKGSRLYDGNLKSNMQVVAQLVKNGVDIKAPLDMDKLKVHGTVLGNMTFDDLKTLIPSDAEVQTVLDDVATKVSKGMEKLYNGTMGVEMLGKVLGQNPALMILARVDSTEDGKYALNYDKNMLNALMLAVENYIAVNGGDLAFNTKLDVSKIIGIGEYDPKLNQIYNKMMSIGKLHTTIASRIGDDFARAVGFNQGEMGTEQYRKLVADLGNTALILAKANNILEEPRMNAEQWNSVAGDGSKMPADSKTAVKFVRLKPTKMNSVETRAHMSTVLKRMNDTLDSLDEQSTYRTHRINAVKNEKQYEIDGSPFGIPEQSQAVMRQLEDQTYVIHDRAMKELLKAYRDPNTKEMVMNRAGWVNLDTMKNSLLDDVDSQRGANREIEDTLAKLDEMERAYEANEITDEVFFNWFFTSNGRYMIDSIGINPQADKHFSRFLLVPAQNYNREWNMKDPIDQRLMYDGIAQAFGHDIDKSTSVETKEFAEGVINKFKTDKEFISKVINGSIKVPHFGHAVQAIEFIKDMKEGGRFDSTLTAEYDAKTSGPMHKLMQAPILDDGAFGAVTKEWLSKGAILVNSDFDESSAAHVGTLEDGYQTITKEADKALERHVPLLRTEERVISDYRKLFKGLNGLLDKLVAKGRVTKQGRDLGKQAFVPFGYAASTETIKRNIGETLAYDILRKIVDSKFGEHEYVREQLGMTAREYTQLQKDLREKPANDVRIKTPQGVQTFKKTLIEILSEMFTMTYGEAYKDAMTGIFAPQVAMNTAIKGVTSAMFRMWKIKYDELIAQEPNATTERKMALVKSLEDYFPLIKAPWSNSKDDGIAIFATKRASMKNEELPAVNTTVNEDGKLSSETVQAMITEMEETFAAGAVLPIHWIDGTQIASVLMRGGITGVHDAIVIGLKGSETEQAIKDMNKAMYDINKSYNMFDEFQLSLLNMIDKVDDETLNTFARQEAAKEDKGVNIAQLKDQVDNIAANIRQARESLYSNEVTVGNIIAFENTEFKSGKTDIDVNPNTSAIKKLLKKVEDKVERVREVTNVETSAVVAESGISKLTQTKYSSDSNKSTGIVFDESSSPNYGPRTYANASADATIVFAVDFTTAGEKLTKTAVLKQNKAYIPIDINSVLPDVDATASMIVSILNSTKAKTLNIAGNGLYTLKRKYPQQELDRYVHQVLSAVVNHEDLGTKIVSIRSGGQTGVDEAGAKAGLALGIPTLVHAPKSWTFRNSIGKDISNERLFKERFNVVQEKTLPSQAQAVKDAGEEVTTATPISTQGKAKLSDDIIQATICK